jgi:hypothetical protein
LLSICNVSNRFEIVVQGIDEPTLVTEIEQTIRAVLGEMSLPGSWRVTVKPSPVSGRWDFTVHGLDVRHSLSIAVPPNLLPALIPSRLEESLNVCSLARVKTARPELSILRRASN